MNLKTIAVSILLTLVICSNGLAVSAEDREIQLIKEEIQFIGADWTPGHTSVSNLSDHEKRQLTLPGEPETPTCPIVSPVVSQGNCGSCWAFAVVAGVESAFRIYAGVDDDLSEQHLVSDCYTAGDCDGGWPSSALKYVRDTGISNEACYPYTASEGSCNPCDGWETHTYNILDFVAIKSTTEYFKWALIEYGPLMVVVHVPDDWYYYKSGVYEPTAPSAWANHAVLLVGWSDSDGCWIIKNSWGARWGEQGYARVKYGNLEKYEYAYGITGVVEHGTEPVNGTWVTPTGAIGSSIRNDKYRSIRSIDGNISTHWFAHQHDEAPFIMYDLGVQQKISQIRAMVFEEDRPITLDVEVTVDGVSWTTVKSNFTINDAGFVETIFEPVACRYVRLRMIDGIRWGTCTEFSVWVVEEEPQPSMIVVLNYPDIIEEVAVTNDVISISLVENGTTIFEWWNVRGSTYHGMAKK